MDSNVKVAVRVRPFNKREQELKCKCVVDMVGNQTVLLPYEKEAQKRFTFDYSFWSFDEFKEEKGVFVPTSGKYADQRKVFETMGTGILKNAYEGYNCSLFAYGQTGSGKSYSMIGFGQNKGIVPITCDEIFKAISANKDPNASFDVQISMLQIYNEIIQDLLIGVGERPSKGLPIRQSPNLGVYVQGSKKVPVSSFQAISQIMEKGTQNRTVASTQMNATSSRAHTIIELTYTQKTKSGDGTTSKTSIINLIDLAGSQRQSKTGASGQRLKEAVGINLSLTTLGQVISALADNASGGKQFVPYRNSALTRVLQNALGGNSMTIMICAVSPATDNYEESLSTLRYADQAKKIKNKPVVNESETDKMIRNLQEQNEKLKKMLEGKGIDPSKMSADDADNEDDQEALAELEELRKRLAAAESSDAQKKDDQKKFVSDIAKERDELAKQLMEREDQLKKAEEEIKKYREMEMNKAKEAAGGELSKEQAKEVNKKVINHIVENNIGGSSGQADTKQIHGKIQQKVFPYLENVSKDEAISRLVKIYITKVKTTVGKKDRQGVKHHDIIVGGSDVKSDHACIVNNDNKLYIVPTDSALCFVNGRQINQLTRIFNFDRVVFGWNSCFVLFDPKNEKDRRKGDKEIPPQIMDWDFFKNEMPLDIDREDDQDGGCCALI